LSVVKSGSGSGLSAALRRQPAADDGEARGRGPIRFTLRAAAIAAGFVIMVVLLYQAALHGNIPDSDGATVVLQGKAMSSGNLLLNGWALSVDPFWTIDAVFYTVIELVTGMRATLLYLVPAIIAALVILVGVILARDRRGGAAGAAATVTVLALLAFPSHALTTDFVHGALHVGTTLWCLIAFAGLRSGRVRWGWAVAVVFLTAGLLGDLETVAIGLAPVVAAGLVAVLRTRDWRSGVPGVCAAAAALLLAALIREAAIYAGTFSINPGHPRAKLSQLPVNLKYLVHWGANLLGLGSGSFGSGGVPAPLQAVHVIGLLVVLAAVGTATAALIRGAVLGNRAAAAASGSWRLDDLLVFAFFADLVVFLALTLGDDIGFARELTAAIIFGAILAGRWAGRLVTAIGSAWIRRAGAVAGLAVVTAFAVGFGLTLTAPRPIRPYDQLAQFLAAHHLSQGVGDYWSSSITTAASGGTVTVRPVFAKYGKVVRYRRQSGTDWYKGQTFQFLVYNKALPWQGVGWDTANATFGHVARTYFVGTYRVLVWNHPIEVAHGGLTANGRPGRTVLGGALSWNG
jgi:hypothetical protein